MAMAEEQAGYDQYTVDEQRKASMDAAHLANLQQVAAPGLGVGSYLPQQWYPSQKPWDTDPNWSMAPAPAGSPAPAPYAPAPASAPMAYAPAPAPAPANAGTPLITPDGEVYGTLEVNAQGQTVVRKLPKGKPNRWNVPADRAARYPLPPGFEPPAPDAGSGLPDFETLMAQLRAGLPGPQSR